MSEVPAKAIIASINNLNEVITQVYEEWMDGNLVAAEASANEAMRQLKDIKTNLKISKDEV